MTQDEKIGQLNQSAGIVMPGIADKKRDELITQGKVGSILWLNDVKEITTFKFTNLRVSKSSMGAGDTNEASVDVTNTGSVPGDAVAQLYIHQRYGSVSRLVRQLDGFQRISLQAGETKTIKFPLTKDELQFWSPLKKQWVVEPTEFDVWAGEDSTASLHAEFTVKP